MPWVNLAAFIAGQPLPAQTLNDMRGNFQFLHDQGADLAAAATITPTTQFHKVTGNTQINNVTVLAAGARLVLWFTGTPKLKHNNGGAGSLLLAGGTDYTAAVNDVIHIVSDGTNWYQIGAASGSLTYRKNTVKDVTTPAGETDLLNGEITIGAGALGTTKHLRGVLEGDFLFNRGTADSLSIRVSLGGTDLYYSGAVGGGGADLRPAGLSATRRPWQLRLDIMMQNASNKVVLGGHVVWSNVGTAAATGFGDLNPGSCFDCPFGSNGAVTIDTTVARLLEVKVAWSVVHANNSWRLQGADFVIN